MHEARQILMDLKGKHPEIDVDATLAGAQMVETYPQGAVGHDLSIGGELAGRSMVKSSLAWAFAYGVDWALSYLRDKGAPPCFGYYHGTDLIQGRPAGVPLHCLSVEADAATGPILGYGSPYPHTRQTPCGGGSNRCPSGAPLCLSGGTDSQGGCRYRMNEYPSVMRVSLLVRPCLTVPNL